MRAASERPNGSRCAASVAATALQCFFIRETELQGWEALLCKYATDVLLFLLTFLEVLWGRVGCYMVVVLRFRHLLCNNGQVKYL